MVLSPKITMLPHFIYDAKANGSNLRAEVLKPDSGYNKAQSMLWYQDENGKIVRRYQSKYGKDDKATGKLFEKGDYRGQRKLVPEEVTAEGSKIAPNLSKQRG